MLLVPFAWLFLAIVVMVAANTRHRSPLGWFFLAIIISPLLAGLLLLALPDLRPSDIAVDERALRRNVRASAGD